ncbi:MAG TPA: S53 family peptidase [Solirubrobacteraceae bacterium]|nr:S53 family peptidase [Solirubrobacteraceae bacterium]
MTSGTARRMRSAALAASLCVALGVTTAASATAASPAAAPATAASATAVPATAVPAATATIAVAGAATVAHGSRVLGPAPAGQIIHMTVTLRPRDRAALMRYATAVSTPGSPLYHAYLNPGQFAARFGAPAPRIATVSRWLRARGLEPAAVSRGGLSIAVTATAGRLQRALGISLNRLALPAGRRALAARAAPVVPAAVAGAVQSLVGLDTVSRRPLLRRPARIPRLLRARSPRATAHVVTGGPQPCTAASSAAAAQSAYTADQIASAYGFSGPYTAGDLGAGVTVAMYELEPVSTSDLAAYQACYGLHSDISFTQVDGGAGAGSGSGESALDIENLIGLAPAAHVIVYEGPNSSSGSPGAGPYDIFSAIVNQDRAQVVSVSWGECEAALGATDAQAESNLFAQAAVQGQTIVAAGGDSGAQDCNTSGQLPQTQPAVDDPASQPLVTGVGGTTLSALGPRPTESVWNQAGTVATAALQPGAGGGGVSGFWAMPLAQRSAAAGLGVLGPGASGAPCRASGGYCREVPDVAVDANPTTGYLIYWNGDGSTPGQPAGWQVIGGTSGGAPVVAALMALADSSPGCAHGPIGDALPGLYRAAGSGYGADFNDVQSGNNDFTGTNGGQYAARPGYDEASGLGSPNAAALISALCANTLHLDAPGNQVSAAHAAVTLHLHGGDAPGTAFHYYARGLPPGLRLAAGSGIISGAPTRHGRYAVTVAAVDASGAISRRLVWTVGTPAVVGNASLNGTRRDAPVLSLAASAGRGSPALSVLRLTLPGTLTLDSVRGVVVRSGRRRIAVRPRRAGRTLILTLRRPAHGITVTVGPRGLSLVAGRGARAVRGGAVTILLTDASGGRSGVRIVPRVRS